MPVESANTTALSVVWLLPGIPGFLVWELKENWRLYAANRPEDLRPVTSGPYRAVRHPNYLAVTLELLAAGLMYSAFLSTAVVAALNLWAIINRIHAEEEVLFRIPAYRDAMANKARLIPGIY